MINGLGAVAPTLDAQAARVFWQGINDGKLLLPRCAGCGRWQWYPVESGACHDGELDWQELPGTGVVFTFTVVRHPFLPELSAALPLTVALLQLDGTEQMRFVAVLDVPAPSIGMRVAMQIQQLGGRQMPVFVEAG